MLLNLLPEIARFLDFSRPSFHFISHLFYSKCFICNTLRILIHFHSKPKARFTPSRSGVRFPQRPKGRRIAAAFCNKALRDSNRVADPSDARDIAARRADRAPRMRRSRGARPRQPIPLRKRRVATHGARRRRGGPESRGTMRSPAIAGTKIPTYTKAERSDASRGLEVDSLSAHKELASTNLAKWPCYRRGHSPQQAAMMEILFTRTLVHAGTVPERASSYTSSLSQVQEPCSSYTRAQRRSSSGPPVRPTMVSRCDSP